MRNVLTSAAIIATVVRRVRESAGISQERLAVRAGVTRTYVGRVERGVLNPTIVTMNRLLGAIGVPWAEFGAALDRELAAASENRAAGRVRRPPVRKAP